MNINDLNERIEVIEDRIAFAVDYSINMDILIFKSMVRVDCAQVKFLRNMRKLIESKAKG